MVDRPKRHPANSGLTPRRTMIAIEPRMMFDGAMAATGSAIMAAREHGLHHAPDPAHIHADADHAALLSKAVAIAKPVTAAKPLITTSFEPPAPIAPIVKPQADARIAASVVAPTSTPITQIVFIDSNVADKQTLIAGITDKSVEVVVLKSGSDGVQQITDELAKHSDLKAVHIISHGFDGGLELGDVVLDQSTLAKYSSEIAQWRFALQPGADLLLYGCNVAKDSTGVSFINRLNSLTGATVAASSDDTGDVADGGNWVLERSTGVIDVSPVIAKSATDAYHDLLANTPPKAGGNVTALDTSNNPIALLQDTTGVTTIRIKPTTLVDPDGGTVTQIRLISVTGGTVTTSSGAAITFGQSGTLLTLTGGAVDLKFTLTPTASGAQLVYVVVDAQSTTAPNSPQSVVSIPVTPVNHAPSLNPNVTLQIDSEFQGAVSTNPGTSMATIMTRAQDLSVRSMFDIDNGATVGIAITGTSGANGQWQYSTDNGAHWVTITGVSNSNALLLDAQPTTRLRFFANSTWNGTATNITIRAWDETSGTASTNATPQFADTTVNGGSSAFSLATTTMNAKGVLTTGSTAAPTVFASGIVTMAPGAASVVVSPSIFIDDAGTSIMNGASVTIAQNYQSGEDFLNFTTQNGITGTFNATTGTLTLTGAATIANYQTALRSITYSANGTYQPFVSIAREVQFRVTDSLGHTSDVGSGFATIGTSTGGVAVTTANDTITTNGNTPITIAASTLLGNDNVGSFGRLVGVTSGPGGTASYDPQTGMVTFTPDAGFIGTATFTYQFAPQGLYDSGSNATHLYSLLPWVGKPLDTQLNLTGQVNPFANNQIIVGSQSGAVGRVVYIPTGTQTTIYVDMISGHFWANDLLTPTTGTGDGKVTGVVTGAFEEASFTTAYGMKGYMVTDQSAAENAALLALAAQTPNNGGTVVTGGTDNLNEGVWIYNVPIGPGTGAGLEFWQGVNNGSNYGGYANWSTGEPNNAGNGVNGEDHMQLFTGTYNPGQWNDIASNGAGGIYAYRSIGIEYGGQATDTPIFSTATVTVTVKSTPPVVVGGTGGIATLPDTNQDATNPPGETVQQLFAPVYQDPFYALSHGGVAITGNLANPADGAWQYSTDGGATWTTLATNLSDTNAVVLNATDQMRFLPVFHVASTPGTLTARLWDGTQGTAGAGKNITALIGGNGAFSDNADEATVVTKVDAQPHAPEVHPGGPGTTTLGPTTVNLSPTYENVVTPPGDTVRDLFANTYYDFETTNFSAAGVIIVDNGSANPTTQGVWQYSTDGGTSWVNVPTVSLTNGFILNASDRLRFDPAAFYAGTPPSMTLLYWDGALDSAHTFQDTTAVYGANNDPVRGGKGTFSADTITLDTLITAVNHAPVATGGTATLANVDEDTTNPAGDTVYNMFNGVYTDQETTDFAQGGIAITANNSTSTQGTWQYSTDGGSVWTTLGSVSTTHAFTLTANDKLRFVPSANWNGTPGTLTAVLWDRASGFDHAYADTTLPNITGGNGVFSVGVVTLSTGINPVNDAPVNPRDPSVTTVQLPDQAEDTPSTGDTVGHVFSGVYSDVETPFANAGVAITGNLANPATEGTWQYSTDNSITWVDFPPVSDGSALLLASTDRIRFAPVLNYNGSPGALTARLWDRYAGTADTTMSTIGQQGGSGTFSATVVTANVTIQPVNDAPVPLTGTATLPDVLEDTTNPPGATVATLFAGVYSDVETPLVNGGIAITGDAATSLQGTWQYSTDGGTTWSNVGAVSATNAFILNSSDYVRFVPKPLYFGTPGKLTVVLWDASGGAAHSFVDTTTSEGDINTLPYSATTVDLVTAVDHVNHAPVVTTTTTATLPTVDEDAANPSGTTVATLFGATFSDVDPGTTTGVAITGNLATSAQGKWQYSTDGTTWTDLPPVSATNVFTLKNTDYLRFLPGTLYYGTPGGLTAQLWDQSSGAAETGQDPTGSIGGHGAFSTGSVTLGTTVIKVNHAPVVTGATATLPSVPEDSTNPNGATVASLFGPDFTDVEQTIGNGGVAVTGNTASASTEGKWQYSTDNGAHWTDIGTVSDSAALTLAATDRVRFLPFGHFNGTPTALTVRLWDGTRDSADQVVDTTTSTGVKGAYSVDTIALGTDITFINHAPTATGGTVSLTNQSQDSTNPPGDTVGNLFGGVFSDIESTSLTGVAIVGDGANASDGKWQYQLGGTGAWIDVSTSVSDTNALVLNSADKLRFLPANGKASTPSGLVTRLWDGSAGSAGAGQNLTGLIGGQGAFSDDADKVVLDTTIFAVPHAPVATGGTATLTSVTRGTTNARGDTVEDLFAGVYSDRETPISGAGIAITADAANPANGAWQYSTDGGATWVNVPPVSDANALTLTASDRLRFQPSPTYAGTPGNLTVRLWDQASGTAHTMVDTTVAGATGGMGTYSTATVDLRTAITAHAPVATNDSVTLPSVSAGVTDPRGDTVGHLFGGVYTDQETPISGGGVAVVGNFAKAKDGTWQYSTNDGASWTDMPPVSNGSAFTLVASDKLRFVPGPGFQGQPGRLTVRLWDRSLDTAHRFVDTSAPGASGGMGTFSVATVDVFTGVNSSGGAVPVEISMARTIVPDALVDTDPASANAVLPPPAAQFLDEASRRGEQLASLDPIVAAAIGDRGDQLLERGGATAPIIHREVVKTQRSLNGKGAFQSPDPLPAMIDRGQGGDARLSLTEGRQLGAPPVDQPDAAPASSFAEQLRRQRDRSSREAADLAAIFGALGGQ